MMEKSELHAKRKKELAKLFKENGVLTADVCVNVGEVKIRADDYRDGTELAILVPLNAEYDHQGRKVVAALSGRINIPESPLWVNLEVYTLPGEKQRKNLSGSISRKPKTPRANARPKK
jgi:hypothetical protein